MLTSLEFNRHPVKTDTILNFLTKLWHVWLKIIKQLCEYLLENKIVLRFPAVLK